MGLDTDAQLVGQTSSQRSVGVAVSTEESKSSDGSSDLSRNRDTDAKTVGVGRIHDRKPFLSLLVWS